MLDVEREIEQSEREFADLIDELEGDEFDMLVTLCTIKKILLIWLIFLYLMRRICLMMVFVGLFMNF